MKRILKLVAALGLATLFLIVLVGCNATKVADLGHGRLRPGSRPCGAFNLAVFSWVGAEANAAVISYVAEEILGCSVKQKHLAEQVSWQGLSTGQVDAIVENWGHDDLKKQYIDTMGAAQSAGSTGIKGRIGWYVPPAMVERYPDITDWHSLNKYADLFKTSESGDKGQLLDGDPSYVTNDAALIANLGLNYKVVQGGSESALISSIRRAQQQRTPLLAYFFSPQWLFNEIPMVKVNLPPYTPGCDADPAKIACDYPVYDLDKIVSNTFAKSGSPAYTLVKQFHWTEQDQNSVARMIVDGMSDYQAAKKFVDAHPQQVAAWLAGTGAEHPKEGQQ
ncbi:ABC transporter substrate-binding protein [Mycobacterium stomatepiae]|uniref:Glycine/betaine-binding protein n=1 Tax=Mycobacterium stomatepiae TaxID=470076 RepID=A0A7I7Q778_9MYCO|nr:ABC transporter substrate-binding protein [Mycobacterium stomatepiae]MCV7163046.1 ABC transporter substrate-binding protein [Mycobacterium stomatepiae]BBY22200.1 glycine/betaine-binding protein [Mycobacterium stomatepiae]